MTLRPDPSLSLPPLPARIDLLGGEAGSLELAGPAADGTFAVEGRAASALGLERGPASWVRIGGRVVAADLGLRAGRVANVVTAPGVLRRERLGPGLSVTETLLAAPDLPLLVLQWSAAGGGTPADEMAVTATLLPGARRVACHRTEDGVVVVDEDAPEERLVAAVVPTPRAMTLEEAPGGGVELRVSPAGRHATLLLAGGPEARVRTALHAGAHLDAHARRAGSAPEGGLVLRSGIAELDDAVGWARARVAASLQRQEMATALEPVVYAGLGALAAGDGEAARAALARIEELPVPGDPLPVILAARLSLTLGDPRPAERWARRLRSEELDAPPALRARAFRSLADALAYAATEEEVAELRARARAGRSGGGGVRLPMAGQAPREPAHPTDALAWLLGDGSDPPPAAPLPDELTAWVAARKGYGTEAWQRWRGDLDAGLEPGPLGRGSWDDPTSGVGAPMAGLHLCTLVHGLLGWAPDAPMGRAVLAPALPGHLTRFAAAGLTVGDVRAELRYQRSGAVLTFRIEPTAGRAPPMLVFEPLVPGAPTRVRVDGEEAEVDPRPTGGGVRLPLQFALDQPREVQVELADG